MRAIKDFLKKHPDLDRSDRGAVQKALLAENKRLQEVHDKAMRKLLSDTRPQRRAIASFAAMLELTRCEGRATQLFWSNVDPITTKTTKLRKEWSFKDLPDDQLIGESRPILDSAVGKDNKPYPTTFVPISDTYVTRRGTMLVLGCDFEGPSMSNGGRTSQPRRAVALGNVSTKILGPDPWTAKTAAKLKSTYTSTSEAMKSMTMCGNHPVVHPKSKWEDEAVTAYRRCCTPAWCTATSMAGPSCASPCRRPTGCAIGCSAAGSGRTYLSDAARRRGEVGGMPLALVEVSNERLDDINVVFSSSKTAWSGGEHSCELELASRGPRRHP